MREPVDVLILGCGYTGTAVARAARSRGQSVLTTVRSEVRAEALEGEGFAVVRVASLAPEDIAAYVDARTHMVVSFPPDGSSDARLAPCATSARAVTYVSATSVYGDVRGRIDDTTPLPSEPSARARVLLAAEDAWRAAGATVLRCPGIYGRERGLHRRVVRGEHRIPGDGSNFISRIHVEDLAALILAAPDVGGVGGVRGETFVVGDREPASQAEVVAWICAAYGVPFPPSVPLDEVHETLRGDRRIDASRALAMLGVTLRFPSYREGMAP